MGGNSLRKREEWHDYQTLKQQLGQAGPGSDTRKDGAGNEFNDNLFHLNSGKTSIGFLNTERTNNIIKSKFQASTVFKDKNTFEELL